MLQTFIKTPLFKHLQVSFLLLHVQDKLFSVDIDLGNYTEFGLFVIYD